MSILFSVYIRIILFVSLAVMACKPIETTNAPVKTSNPTDENGQPVVLIAGTEVVGLDKVPRLTVTLNVGSCMGSSKWQEATIGDNDRSGAVSIAPRSKDALDTTQPEAKVFQPIEPEDSNDSSSHAKAVYVWRLKKASYSVEAIAYNEKTTKPESSISKDFDLSSNNDLTLAIEGSWQASTNTCKLDWK